MIFVLRHMLTENKWRIDNFAVGLFYSSTLTLFSNDCSQCTCNYFFRSALCWVVSRRTLISVCCLSFAAIVVARCLPYYVLRLLLCTECYSPFLPKAGWEIQISITLQNEEKYNILLYTPTVFMFAISIWRNFTHYFVSSLWPLKTNEVTWKRVRCLLWRSVEENTNNFFMVLS